MIYMGIERCTPAEWTGPVPSAGIWKADIPGAQGCVLLSDSIGVFEQE